MLLYYYYKHVQIILDTVNFTSRPSPPPDGEDPGSDAEGPELARRDIRREHRGAPTAAAAPRRHKVSVFPRQRRRSGEGGGATEDRV